MNGFYFAHRKLASKIYDYNSALIFDNDRPVNFMFWKSPFIMGRDNLWNWLRYHAGARPPKLTHKETIGRGRNHIEKVF